MKKFPPIIKGMPVMLHGGDYNPEQWINSREIWEEDMRLAKLANINTFSVGIFSWAMLEPEEGVYNFSWLDEIMDMLSKNGIKAMLATPSGARPPWLSQACPEVLRTGSDRRRSLFGGRHNHCYTSPVYREKTKKINEMLAKRYKGHKALGLWHISNELSGECHCELCQEAFRNWLKARYSSLDELNGLWWTAFWSHRYSDWSQIESPSPIGERDLHALNLDWKRFVTSQTIDFLRNEAAPLRRLTPDVPITVNMMGFYSGLNYNEISKEEDVVSWDSYPVWRGDENDVRTAAAAAMSHDIFRSYKGKPFMLMESSPSVTNWQSVSKLRRPGTLLMNSIQAVAHGSDTVQYFQFRKSRGGAEKFHGAVVDHEGSENTRVFKEVSAVGSVLGKLSQVAGAAREADIAIIYDIESQWALEDSKGYKQDKKYLPTLIDFYEPFWENGATVDVIDQTHDLSGYRLVVAPMAYMIRPGFAEKAKLLVERGGVFVGTFLSGIVDESDLCFLKGAPGPLKELFGVWCEETDCLYDGEQSMVGFKGKAYAASDFCDIVHLQGAKALGWYEEDFYKGFPAVTMNEYGKGQALYIAARMEKAFLSDLFDELIRSLGIATPFSGKLPYGCTAQTRTDGEVEYVFIMNFGTKTALIDVEGGGASMLTGKAVAGILELHPMSLEIVSRPVSPEKRKI
ncbi:MAG: beta-galactosidase [Clostridiales bacterium]|jgi:beta-galactosidase|nr:beta-galactosidase [Clostridiales bacterium]